MRSELLAALNEEVAARRAAVLVTELATGEQRLVRADDISRDPFASQLEDHLRTGKSSIIDIDEKRYFLLVRLPPARMIIVGAVHISQALAPMMKLAGFNLAIIDPRTAFATAERFPDVDIIAEWPQDILPKLQVDRYTGMVVLTHDPRIDDPALEAALAADCFYIGALGSRKTHAARLERLKRAGFEEDELTRIRAPIGLDIGATTPSEIAIAILAEIIAALRTVPSLKKSAA
jgi:xanthine dehydrogenase accessory factor